MLQLNEIIVVLLVISVALIFISVRKKYNKKFFFIVGEISFLTTIALAFSGAYIITIVWFMVSSTFFLISLDLTRSD